MTKQPASPFRCPICKQPVARGSEHFPFCGERCRVVDLGHWAAEDYRIAGDPVTLPDEESPYA